MFVLVWFGLFVRSIEALTPLCDRVTCHCQPYHILKIICDNSFNFLSLKFILSYLLFQCVFVIDDDEIAGFSVVHFHKLFSQNFSQYNE